MPNPIRPTSLDGIKRLAKALKDKLDIAHTEALELVAKQAGFQGYTHARRCLESERPLAPAAVFPDRPTRSPGMNVDEFLALCRDAWAETIRQLNPMAGNRVIWESQAEVLRVLERVHAHTCSHTHLPTGGGHDFLAAAPSPEKGCIEFEIEPLMVYVARPKRLILEHLPQAPAQSFLFLELDNLAPSAVYEPRKPDESRGLHDRYSRQETVIEISPGDYVGLNGRDKDGNQISVPKHARTVVRGFNGAILIATKGSLWNQSRIYEGQHETLGPEEIRAILERVLGRKEAA